MQNGTVLHQVHPTLYKEHAKFLYNTWLGESGSEAFCPISRRTSPLTGANQGRQGRLGE